MKNLDFKTLTRDDVVKAVDYFNEHHLDYRAPRNTFLKYDGKLYPGKLIRKLAYELKNKTQISSDDLNGGKETVRFFERLGFDTVYKPGHVETHPRKRKSSQKEDLKIGLYNQKNTNKNLTSFNRMKKLVKDSDLDLLVFPEFCYVPFIEDFNRTDLYDNESRDKLVQQILTLSRELGTAVVINSGDQNGFIITIYANTEAKKEDQIRFHLKHTYTSKSYYDLTGTEDFYNDQYLPVELKQWKLAFSICFDLLLPILDKIKKKNGAEIILNSTGGSVKRGKWIYNLRTRALENNLFYFVTMGEGSEKKTVITGVTPDGCEIISEEIGDEISGPIKKFVVKETGTKTREFDDEIKQSLNKKPNYRFDLKEVDRFNSDYVQIDKDTFIHENGKNNIVFILIDSEEIFRPDLILKKMFSPKLDSFANKKFILINRWDHLDDLFFKNRLLPILRTRATENFCAVLFISPDKKLGFQSNKSKESQVLPIVDDQIELDLTRMGGPETFWRNHGKTGKKWLISFKENLNIFEK